MTKKTPSDDLRCAWCAAVMPKPVGRGRPRRFCKRSHRQRHFEARQTAVKLGLGADDVLVSRMDVEDLQDRLYVLEAALEDVETDLAASSTVKDYADAYVHLLEGCLGLRSWRLEPRAIGGPSENA